MEILQRGKCKHIFYNFEKDLNIFESQFRPFLIPWERTTRGHSNPVLNPVFIVKKSWEPVNLVCCRHWMSTPVPSVSMI